MPAGIADVPGLLALCAGSGVVQLYRNTGRYSGLCVRR